MDKTSVAGEPVDKLLPALLKFRCKKRADEMMDLEVKLEPDLAVPFQRALMRVDAELLLSDADALSPENSRELRTDPQRRADALVELVQRVGAAYDNARAREY